MKTPNHLRSAVAAVCLILTARAHACMYHWATGQPEPQGIWLNDGSGAAAKILAQDAADDAAITSAVLAPTSVPAASPTVDTYVTGWLINTTGLKGRSTDSTVNASVSLINANVQQVAYTATNVYVKVTGIPDYNVGPFNGNPNVPANTNATFDIVRNPTPATTHTATGLGAIGVLVNGVEFFNMSDANSYQNQGVWHNNAGVVEKPSFDSANAHPQQQGVYHNHMNPVSLISELGGSSTNPVVIGYAIDGYPILSGYASLTSGGAVVKMMSGYSLRTYSGNVRGNGGPNVAGQYVLGYFEEDYQYVANQTLPAGESELDQYNGAFVYTPQFPNGTYAYFATTDVSGNAAYPYLVGPQYYGTPSTDDLPGGTVIVPADAINFIPEPAAVSLVALAAMPLLSRRRHHRRSR
jgi:hypothetical protein